MLIQEMLKHDINDFYFAGYYSGNAGFVSLLLKKDDKYYYDVRNNRDVYEYQIRGVKPLTNYVKSNKQFINIRTAKRLAQPHYDKFYKDYDNERTNKPEEPKTIGGMAI